MTINLESCSFHKENPAISSCTRCHRLLCSEDRNNIKTWHHSGEGEFGQNYCPICYVTPLINNRYESLIGIFIGLIFVPAIIFLPVSIALILAIFPFFIIVASIQLYKIRGSKLSRVEKDADNFISSLNNKSVLFTSIKGTDLPTDFDPDAKLTIKDPKHLVCFQCGGNLLITDKICPKCGDSSKDELQAKF